MVSLAGMPGAGPRDHSPLSPPRERARVRGNRDKKAGPQPTNHHQPPPPPPHNTKPPPIIPPIPKSQKSQFRPTNQPTNTPTTAQHQTTTNNPTHPLIPKIPVQTTYVLILKMNSKFIAALTSADTPPPGGQRTMRQSVNTTNKTNLPSPCESKEDEVALRVNALWRRTPSDCDQDERSLGPVRNASTNKVQSRRTVDTPQHEPDAGHRRPRAGRACVNPADVGRQSPRRRGYRASSGDNRAMGGGFFARHGRRPVRRSGNVGRGWFGKVHVQHLRSAAMKSTPVPFAKRRGREQAKRRSQGMPESHLSDLAG